jgi:flagellar motor switch/type III secretory pathway protein FliN
MSIIDQSEIDNLLAEAGEPPPTAPEPQPVPAMPQGDFSVPDDPEVHRILKVRVPVIVELASRTMPIANVRRLAVGSIIEFEKSVEQPLDLKVRNRKIGAGTCVKVGENFGMRVVSICNRAQRIRSLGPGQG